MQARSLDRATGGTATGRSDQPPGGPHAQPAPAPPRARRRGLLSVPAFATDLTVTCRCVEGGVNSDTAKWVKESVIPGFTEKMQAEGKDVTVTLKEFAGQDEQLTQQLALDFSTGAGADVSGFDGFLIPSFVEGGPPEAARRDRRARRSTSGRAGRTSRRASARSCPTRASDYGIALGTDARMIFVRKDLFEKAGLDAGRLAADLLGRRARRRPRDQEGGCPTASRCSSTPASPWARRPPCRATGWRCSAPARR